jgi:hypothetical protein
MMTCTHIGSAIICDSGPTLKIVDGKGKLWHFEMHPYCGPGVLTPKTGEVMDPQPNEKSPFWSAVTHWAQQGKKFDPPGVCLWVEPPPIRIQNIGGRNFIIN